MITKLLPLLLRTFGPVRLTIFACALLAVAGWRWHALSNLTFVPFLAVLAATIHHLWRISLLKPPPPYSHHHALAHLLRVIDSENPPHPPATASAKELREWAAQMLRHKNIREHVADFPAPPSPTRFPASGPYLILLALVTSIIFSDLAGLGCGRLGIHRVRTRDASLAAPRALKPFDADKFFDELPGTKLLRDLGIK